MPVKSIPTVATGLASFGLARFFMYGLLIFSFPLQFSTLLVGATMAIDIYTHYLATKMIVTY